MKFLSVQRLSKCQVYHTFKNNGDLTFLNTKMYILREYISYVTYLMMLLVNVFL